MVWGVVVGFVVVGCGGGVVVVVARCLYTEVTVVQLLAELNQFCLVAGYPEDAFKGQSLERYQSVCEKEEGDGDVYGGCERGEEFGLHVHDAVEGEAVVGVEEALQICCTLAEIIRQSWSSVIEMMAGSI